MDKSAVLKNWIRFKIFFFIDVFSTPLSLFVSTVLTELGYFSNAFVSTVSIISIFQIGIFQLVFLWVYGDIAFKMTGRQLSSLIGLWKMIPFFGYIPLWFHMRSLMRQVVSVSSGSTSTEISQKSPTDNVSKIKNENSLYKNYLIALENKTLFRLFKVVYVVISIIIIFNRLVEINPESFLELVAFVLVASFIAIIIYRVLRRILVYIIFGSTKR